MKHCPLLSVITPSLNRAKFISEAVQSVSVQRDVLVEHIIVDGGSTDRTLEVLKDFPHLNVVSEPDSGLYDALNKGIRLAQGDIIGFLNTDDVYPVGAIKSVVESFESDTEIEAVVGRAAVFRGDPQTRGGLEMYPPIKPGGFLSQVTLGASRFNAWFFRKDLFDRIGFLRTDFRYSADRDFLIRFALYKPRYICADEIVYLYREHPDSLTITGRTNGESEYHFEDRSLAEQYLDRKDLQPYVRRCLQSWHSKIMADMTLTALRKRGLGRAWHYSVKGLAKDRLWFLMLLKRLIYDSLYHIKSAFKSL